MLTKVVSREKLKLCAELAGMNSNWKVGLKISSVMGWRGRLLGASTTWVQPTCLGQSSLNEHCFLKLPKSTCHSLGSDLGVWDILKLEKEKRKKTEAIWPSKKSWRKRAIFSHFVCEFQREQDIEKESASVWVVQSEWRDREWECERLKKKKEIFFFTQVTHKEDKLVEFSWSF